MTAAEQLADWVALRHQGQLIKRTKKPYFKHVLAVAEMAKPAVDLGYEVGLCHDLLEDTATTKDELLTALLSFGYESGQADAITGCVIELTDVFTAAAYPGLSKTERKELETKRWLTMSPAAQTVKYSDLIYNIGWVLKFDHKHAEQYLQKKKLLLSLMVLGNEKLRQQALKAIDDGLDQINEPK